MKSIINSINVKQDKTISLRFNFILNFKRFDILVRHILVKSLLFQISNREHN